MTLERVNEIIGFWQRQTGRAAPVKVTMTMETGRAGGLFHMGEIYINPIWADDETVFHELAHLEQWQDGRLWYMFEPIISTTYPREVLQDPYHCYRRPIGSVFEGKPVSAIPYKDRPVEIEARTLARSRLLDFAAVY